MRRTVSRPDDGPLSAAGTDPGARRLYRSGFLPGPMRRARVTEDEVRQAARASGKASLDDVAAVVLETDGTLSVLPALPDLDAE